MTDYVKDLTLYKRDDFKWNLIFMLMAFDISRLSKDTSSKIGCVLVSPDKTEFSIGFNGFPSKIPDYKEWWENRDPDAALFTKYDLVDHAERNAIDHAKKNLAGWTAYVTDQPCFNCAKAIYKAGIKIVFYSNKNKIKMDLESKKSEAIAHYGDMKMYFIDKVKILKD